MNLIRTQIPDMNKVAEYLKLSMKEGRLSNFGPVNEEFTKSLEKISGIDSNRRIITTSSGHAALMAAYSALGVRRIVMPAFTFESTRVAATLQGIEPIIVDVDSKTGCLTVDILERIRLDAYDGVVAVCALSTIPDLLSLHNFCRANNKKLIIDGAATWGTPNVANYGDAYCYSFHATKTLPVGEGGALVIADDFYDRALAFTNFGYSVDKRVIISDGFSINAKMSEFVAAIGLASLDVNLKEIATRINNADLYKKKIGEYVPSSSENFTVYAFLPTFVPTSEIAKSIRLMLSNSGIQNMAYYIPIAQAPVSCDLYERSVCLPVHSDVNEEMINEIGNIYKKSLKQFI